MAPPALAEPPAPRRVSFRHLHTGERLSLVYWEDGDYRPEALREVDRLLRDHRSDEIHAIDPKLLDLLYDLRAEVGSTEAYEVISGYRSPTTNAALRDQGRAVAKRSLHMQGKAIDVRLPGCDTGRLREVAWALQRGGVGYYPKLDFVHVDVGRVRFW